MAIPTYEECMLPLMKIAEDGKEHLFREATDALINQFNLTEKEKQELLPSGSAFVINNRIGWARTYLTKAGLLLKTKRGYFRISEEGKKLLQKKPAFINTSVASLNKCSLPSSAIFISGSIHSSYVGIAIVSLLMWSISRNALRLLQCIQPS